MLNTRVRLVRDDSGHWYAIPADKEVEFERWISLYQQDEEVDEDVELVLLDFDQYRLGLHLSWYSFTDMKEDRC